MRRTKRTTWCSWVLGLAAAAMLGSACGGGGGGDGGGGGEGGGARIPPLNAWVQGLGLTPVERYGTLGVCTVDGKKRICSEDGEPVQLRGMSLFWSNTGWGAERFYNAGALNSLADSWNATVVRAAIGAQESGSYNTPGNAEANLDRARAVIDAAITKGMYVIVDWHSHGAGEAGDLTRMTAQATTFFGTLVGEYGDAPNIIWEPFNEPPGSVYSWAQVKAYSEAVLGTIRTTPRAGGTGSPNLVVVGSPTWSQEVDDAAASPIADPNVAYTLHFYANTHGQWLRDRADAAMTKIAIFVTEYGTCDASGNGGFNAPATKDWFEWMDRNLISSANWSLNDKAETASALTPGASSTGPWDASEVTESGLLVLDYIHGGFRNAITVTPAGTGSGAVASSPAGIDCGATCTATYSAATQVTLTATPPQGGTFMGWSGACTGTGSCVVTMQEARAVTATFGAPAQVPAPAAVP